MSADETPAASTMSRESILRGTADESSDVGDIVLVEGLYDEGKV